VLFGIFWKILNEKDRKINCKINKSYFQPLSISLSLFLQSSSWEKCPHKLFRVVVPIILPLMFVELVSCFDMFGFGVPQSHHVRAHK
jgi:hypothetical protein